MTTAVLVMAYGTPLSADDIAAFYTDIRRGHPPTPEQLAELTGRYAAIGEISPLTARTEAQIVALQRALEAIVPGAFTTYYGTKHAPPRIEDAVSYLVEDGASALVGCVLAPHYSALSIGEYIERARTAATAGGVPAAFIERWGDDPLLITMLAERVSKAIASLDAHGRVEVVFTAHSLPARITELGDPYEAEVQRTADLVARHIGLSNYRTAWQSAGRTGDSWLGPDLSEVITALGDEGVAGVVVCPAAFTSDHLEVLYDVDITARNHALSLGMSFARTAMLNDDPLLAQLLAQRVIDACREAFGETSG